MIELLLNVILQILVVGGAAVRRHSGSDRSMRRGTSLVQPISRFSQLPHATLDHKLGHDVQGFETPVGTQLR